MTYPVRFITTRRSDSVTATYDRWSTIDLIFQLLRQLTRNIRMRKISASLCLNFYVFSNQLAIVLTFNSVFFFVAFAVFFWTQPLLPAVMKRTGILRIIIIKLMILSKKEIFKTKNSINILLAMHKCVVNQVVLV